MLAFTIDYKTKIPRQNHHQAGKSIWEITYPRTTTNHGTKQTQDFSLNYLWEMLTPVGVITLLGNLATDPTLCKETLRVINKNNVTELKNYHRLKLECRNIWMHKLH